MPLVPVLKGPAPSAALTSFPSSSFRDSQRCTLSRPFARPNSFFSFPPTPRPARSAFISYPATLGRPAGAAFADGPGRPMNIHPRLHLLSRPAGAPTLPHARRPRTHLPAFRPPLGAGRAPPAGLKVRLPPAALCLSRRRPRPARRARDLRNTTPRGRQAHTTLFPARFHSPVRRLTRALFVFSQSTDAPKRCTSARQGAGAMPPSQTRSSCSLRLRKQ